MAKTQNLSLNPQKISGLCGRLMCCLAYENEYYAEVNKHMPKLGSFVKTQKDGSGIADSINQLKDTVTVKKEKKDGGVEFVEVPASEITFSAKKAPLPTKKSTKKLKRANNRRFNRKLTAFATLIPKKIKIITAKTWTNCFFRGIILLDKKISADIEYQIH